MTSRVGEYQNRGYHCPNAEHSQCKYTQEEIDLASNIALTAVNMQKSFEARGITDEAEQLAFLAKFSAREITKIVESTGNIAVIEKRMAERAIQSEERQAKIAALKAKIASDKAAKMTSPANS